MGLLTIGALLFGVYIRIFGQLRNSFSTQKNVLVEVLGSLAMGPVKRMDLDLTRQSGYI